MIFISYGFFTMVIRPIVITNTFATNMETTYEKRKNVSLFR
jgi:hypothetical protein